MLPKYVKPDDTTLKSASPLTLKSEAIFLMCLSTKCGERTLRPTLNKRTNINEMVAIIIMKNRIISTYSDIVCPSRRLTIRLSYVNSHKVKMVSFILGYPRSMASKYTNQMVKL